MGALGLVLFLMAESGSSLLQDMAQSLPVLTRVLGLSPQGLTVLGEEY